MPGPSVRTDIVEVYVFRRASPVHRPGHAQFLQMRRAPREGAILPGSWQPVMGHIHEGERADQAALREVGEECGLRAGRGLVALWQLEEPNCYFLQPTDCIMLGPCFAAEATADWEPTLDEEHDASRWVPRDHADRVFLWPGQRRAIEQVVRDILDPNSMVERVLRVQLDT